MSHMVSGCLLWWLFGDLSCVFAACWAICLKDSCVICSSDRVCEFLLFHGYVDYTYLSCVGRSIFLLAGLLFLPLLSFSQLVHRPNFCCFVFWFFVWFFLLLLLFFSWRGQSSCRAKSEKKKNVLVFIA